ncbi:hypothetical protein EIN_406230 [Entamoeba invadens IP1]|uniref:Uncharacterized protein n=1 Tax=Entamoeba invadens IP1 TaxID=370355 RepID=A0A0A1UCY7_ENTIV|nr:hypothetical protein EIN_406230 [Entamoeba invadens IP1]ELP90159.1 hypothetical protein EIN_406230 [Entamoeba invadens IP1]|eukprot:XP_004256930.1 hypothetical protein EIN_406230 [Entamoeba invadens IP1]
MDSSASFCRVIKLVMDGTTIHIDDSRLVSALQELQARVDSLEAILRKDPQAPPNATDIRDKTNYAGVSTSDLHGVIVPILFNAEDYESHLVKKKQCEVKRQRHLSFLIEIANTKFRRLF